MRISHLLPGQTRKKLRWLLLDDPVLVSFPKSGRTWVRSMMQDLGIPIILDHAGARRTGAIDKSRHAKKRVILLIRDPRDTVVSFFHHSRTRIAQKYQGTLSEFIREPDRGIGRIVQFNLAWLSEQDRPERFMFVEYEGLREDTLGQMRRMVAFAGRADLSDDRLQSAVSAASFESLKRREAASPGTDKLGRSLTPGDPADPNSFKVRKGKVGGYADEMSPDDLAYCDDVLARHGYADKVARHREHQNA